MYSILPLLTNENETNDRDPITGSEDRIIGADDSRVIGYFFFFFNPEFRKRCITL